MIPGIYNIFLSECECFLQINLLNTELVSFTQKSVSSLFNVWWSIDPIIVNSNIPVILPVIIPMEYFIVKHSKKAAAKRMPALVNKVPRAFTRKSGQTQIRTPLTIALMQQTIRRWHYMKNTNPIVQSITNVLANVYSINRCFFIIWKWTYFIVTGYVRSTLKHSYQKVDWYSFTLHEIENIGHLNVNVALNIISIRTFLNQRLFNAWTTTFGMFPLQY